MIPYILTALGGYLIGSSVKQYADGGQVRLLAPNGKPSNLTPEQYKLVRTPEFKAWFGDWENDPENASKVVDYNGEPLVVYHSYEGEGHTIFYKSIYAIQDGKYNRVFENQEDYKRIKQESEDLGESEYIEFWFSNKDGLFGNNTIKCFLNIRDLKIEYETEGGQGSFGGLTKDYDGISGLKIENVKKEGVDYYVVLFSNQIKLADGSNTTFDGSNPDIRYDKGGQLRQKYYRAEKGDAYKKEKTFIPNGYYERVGADGNPVIKYDEYEISEIPEIAASKNIYGAILGAISMFKFSNSPSKNLSIQIYVIEEKPDVDISHWIGADFEYLQEVRYRKKVLGKHLLELKLSDEAFQLIKDFYEYKAFENELRYDEELEFDDRLNYIYEMIEEDTLYKKIKHLIDKSLGKGDFSNGYLIGSSVKQYADGGQVQLLAPNGKPSNLTPEQYKLVRTPEFKAWFGDWENDPENASKVVDENGEPLVMYHGTQSGYFSEFSKKEIGKNYKELPFGFYFTNIKSPINQLKGYSAIEYAYRNKKRKKFTGYPSASDVLSYVFEVFLDIKNPIVQDVNSESAVFYTTYPVRPAQAIDWKQKELRIIISKGENDGVIAKSGWQKTIEVIAVVLNSNQIKLADGSNTTFDGSNPDIRYNKGGRA